MYSDVVRRVADACLTYSAPSLDPDGDGTPELFVNPFPELNDLGSDGTRSAFPRRAKYNLALEIGRAHV